ncbi:MAG: helix-turn-helix domain-containing protein [Treponema sp.]|nr:helix-turn-helix domain-containing protein [Treponema sp.]
MSTLKNAAQVAEILGIKKSTVYKLARNGSIPHRHVGALLRFNDEDIQAYLESVKSNKGGNNE